MLKGMLLGLAAMAAVVGCGGSAPPTNPPAVAPTIEPIAPTATPAVVATSVPAASAAALTGSEAAAASAPADSTVVEAGGAYPQVRYTPATLTAKAGAATFFLANVPISGHLGSSHNMAIGTELGVALVQSKVLNPGQSEAFTVDGLAPGTYVFFCTVHDGTDPPHYKSGMVGTLTVTP